jgi:hypothetical protein
MKMINLEMTKFVYFLERHFWCEGRRRAREIFSKPSSSISLTAHSSTGRALLLQIVSKYLVIAKGLIEISASKSEREWAF